MDRRNEDVHHYLRASAQLLGEPGDRSCTQPDFVPMQVENRPAPFKQYQGLPSRSLPTDLRPGGLDALAAITGQVAGPTELDETQLARLLFHAVGVTRMAMSAEPWRLYFRAAPSAGNLHPIEAYVVCGRLGEIPAGVHHVDPLSFSLTELRGGDHRGRLAAACALDRVSSAPASLVLTGIPWLSAWKYRERGLRHVYWDAGSILANLLAEAAGIGVAATVMFGFVDRRVADLLGLDGQAEFPPAVVPLGAMATVVVPQSRDLAALPDHPGRRTAVAVAAGVPGVDQVTPRRRSDHRAGGRELAGGG